MDTSFSEPTFRPPPSPRPQLLTPSRPPTACAPLCLILSANALTSQALSTSHLNHHNLGTGLWPPASPSSNTFVCPASQPASHLSIYPSSIHPSSTHPPPYPSSSLPPSLSSFQHLLCHSSMSWTLSTRHTLCWVHVEGSFQNAHPFVSWPPATPHCPRITTRVPLLGPQRNALTAFCPASHRCPVTRVPL